MSRVAVIGGGIAGLTCAFFLKREGISVTLFERESSVGGRMRARTKDHLAFDIGANFLVRAYGGIHRLAQELGVPIHEVSSTSIGHEVFRQGRFCAINFSSIQDVFRMGGLNFGSRLRFLKFVLWVRARYPRLDFFDLSSVPDELNREDAYSCARRNIGGEFADYILDSFNSAMMFHRAAESSAAGFLALFSMMADPSFDFDVMYTEGHMSAIPEALARNLDVRTGCEVTAVEPCAEGLRVTTAPSQQETYRAVVLATTAGAAAKLLGRAAPREHRELLAQTRYAATINVAFRIPSHSLGRTHCFYVPFVENPIVSEFTDESMKGEHAACHQGCSLVNVGLHEAAALDLMDEPDEVVFETVRLELLKLHRGLGGMPAQVLPYDLQRWPEAIPKYDCGQLSRVREFLRTAQGKRGLFLCGDYLNAPWIEGASRMGRTVARAVAAERVPR
ncbi:MAG: FAD-dependent oxidoreductase [Armatimonadetes bacterium]|nr:FAD-dependent oxidoreductase [Armatimonadota bacterium]